MHKIVSGASGLNCSSRIFFNLLLRLESLVVTVKGLQYFARIFSSFIYFPTVRSEICMPIFLSLAVILGAP